MRVKLLNKISLHGLKRFDAEDYLYGEEFEEYDAILVRSAKLHDMSFSKELKCIARAGAGVNNIPLDRCSEEGIVVFNTPGANANAVKELVIAGLLLSARKLVQGINWVKSLCEEADVAQLVEKGKANFVGPEIAGKKLGVIGLGAIGVKVANAAAALDMEVYGYDPYISVQAAWTLKARIHHVKNVRQIFEECDYITLHVPCNEHTKGMIDAQALSSMKENVRLFNFARGELVDENALIEALQAEKLAAYVTDFPSKRLLTVERVIALPHLGASTPESEDNCALMAADEIIEYLQYGNIKNSVNMPEVQMPQEAKYRICIINKNIPDMISSVAAKLSAEGINIENMVSKGRGDYAYTILETNDEISLELLERMRQREGIVRVRIIVQDHV